MTRLARLALGTTVLTFLLAAVGGLVRATDSGLGCPGWPKCYGQWIPPRQAYHPELERVIDTYPAAIIEMTHRYLAFFVSCGVVATCVLAVLGWRKDPKAGRLGLVLVPLVAAQAGLGAYVVHRELEAWTVVAHLALGMAFAAAEIALTVHLLVPRGAPAGADVRRFAGLTAAAVYGQLMLGSYVTGRGAGLVFQDWPLHNGSLLPDVEPPFTAKMGQLQFAHRIWAYVVVALVIVSARKIAAAVGRGSWAARLAHAGAGLAVLQIAIGVLNIYSDLHSAVVTAHLTVATLIWGSTWAAYLVLRQGVAATDERDPRPDPDLAVVAS